MFHSKREKYFWTLATIVLVIIFAALFFGPALIGSINETMLAGIFLSGMILVAITILSQGLRVRPAGIELGIVLGMSAIFILLAVRLSLPERSHLLEFGVLAVLVYEALAERYEQTQKPELPALWAILICSLAGLLDEGLQYLLPERVFDWEDIAFNLLAISTATIGMALLRSVRQRMNSAN